MGQIVMLDPAANPRNRSRELAAARAEVPPGVRTRRPRGRHDYLLLQSLKTTGRVATGSVTVDLEPGELALFTPGTPQEYGGLERPWLHCWIHFQPRSYWLEWLEWPEAAPGLRHLAIDDPAAQAAINHQRQRLLAAASGTKRRRDALAMNALEALLLAADDHLAQRAHAQLDARIATAVDWMQRRLDRAPSLGEIAAAAGLSASRLSHLFKQQLGLAPLRWHERERMRRAAQRLAGDPRPIHQIASELGYDDPLYFSTRFKHHHGVSPRTWRQR